MKGIQGPGQSGSKEGHSLRRLHGAYPKGTNRTLSFNCLQHKRGISLRPKESVISNSLILQPVQFGMHPALTGAGKLISQILISSGQPKRPPILAMASSQPLEFPPHISSSLSFRTDPAWSKRPDGTQKQPSAPPDISRTAAGYAAPAECHFHATRAQMTDFSSGVNLAQTLLIFSRRSRAPKPKRTPARRALKG